jgi:nucleoside-diphosphate-sugar epimerase
VIDSCLRNEEFVIHKDCRFDYLYIEDAARVVLWFIEHEPHHHDYNVVSGKPLLLSELARIVMQKMGNSNGIRILGQNTEYTASNARLLREIGDFKLTSISEGIDKQIAWQKEQI